MALFTDRELETRIDLLTQFYQVEFPRNWREDPRKWLVDSEIDTWTRQNARFEMREATRDTDGGLILGPYPAHSERSLRTLALFAELHEVLVPLMDAAADRKNPDDDDEEAFNILVHKHLGPPLLVWDKANRKPLIYPKPRKGEEGYVALLLTLFSDAARAEALSRCRQCNSVFVVRRTGARAPIYCSVRCRERAASKSYYQRKRKMMAVV